MTFPEPKGGQLIPNLSRDEYDRLARVNWSTAKHMARSPLHYRAALLKKDKDTNPRKLGRVGHLAILEPERFRADVAVWGEEEGQKQRRGKLWEAFKAKHAGREIVTKKEAEDALKLATAVYANPDAAKLLSGGRAEQTLLWTDEVTGLQMKGRVDFCGTGALVDVKTTKDGSPDGFARQVWSFRMDAQLALYQDGLAAVTGEVRPVYVVAVENFPPHVCQVYEVPAQVLQVGRDFYRRLLDELAECQRTSRWPGYVDGVAELSLPRWAAPELVTDDEDASGLGLDFEGSDDADAA